MNELLGTVNQAWHKISSKGRLSLVFYALSLILTSCIDASALIIVAKIITLAGNFQANKDSSDISEIITLGVGCISLFLLRSSLAAGITWIGAIVFAQQETAIGSQNFEAYSNMKWEVKNSERISGIFSFIDRGPHALTQQLLFVVATIASEFFSSIVIFAVLLKFDLITALSSMIFFGATALIQHKYISRVASNAGKDVVRYQNEINDLLADAFHLGKVLQVMPSTSLSSAVDITRHKLAHARAKTVFLESLPRFLMESMLVFGVIFVGLTIFLLQGQEHVIGSLIIFSVAGFRLLPSVNRIQGLILGLLGRQLLAQEGLRNVPLRALGTPRHLSSDTDENFILSVQKLSYSYPNSPRPTINDVSANFRRGYQYAIVGPSGSGKTTLIDLLAGLLEPSSGEIKWLLNDSDKFAYVPQDNAISTTTLRNNVALEWVPESVSQQKVDLALALSKLNFSKSREGINDVGSPISLSGGEKQRLGIARALYRDASIIFLDEPTSSLDSFTEHEVMATIKKLHGTHTIFVIAHRLSTVQNADLVLYLDNGELLGFDTFDALRKKVPNFERQIQLGLISDAN